MNEKQTSETASVRPTKKQRELLTFIEQFIGEHGYSPSYREIMNGLNYTSVATVALHVNSLIKRGHLRKRDFNARSLEVVKPTGTTNVTTNEVRPGEEKWLIDKVEHHFSQAEISPSTSQTEIDNLTTLVDTLRILNLEGAVHSFLERLTQLKKQPASEGPA